MYPGWTLLVTILCLAQPPPSDAPGCAESALQVTPSSTETTTLAAASRQLKLASHLPPPRWTTPDTARTLALQANARSCAPVCATDQVRPRSRYASDNRYRCRPHPTALCWHSGR